jgi:hypothetical protein
MGTISKAVTAVVLVFFLGVGPVSVGAETRPSVSDFLGQVQAWFALMLILSLTVAGCGGSNNSGPSCSPYVCPKHNFCHCASPTAARVGSEMLDSPFAPRF